MKNILKSLVCLIILSNSMTVFSQKNTLETETNFMNCVYQGLPENGAKFKEKLKKAEQKLIELNYLKDASGESYIVLYSKLDNMFDENLKDLGVASYMAGVASVLSDPKVASCLENVFQSPSFEKSKLSKMMFLIQSLDQYEGDLKEDILKILDSKDFEHDYYKMTTFTMIESMNQVSIIPQTLPEVAEEKLTDEQLKNALTVRIDENQQLTVNGEKMAVEKLQKRVISYVKQYESKNIVILQTNIATEYAEYIKVQNEVAAGFEVVRNEKALETYKRPFKELEEKQQEEIRKIYPFRIKD
ncbi:MAG: ExbD/TolR family protein [Kordia sp.]|uniref:ExbD/TolR family protein n=1 Tax=Kordia sp. TaxID=1965332 RepID=UPI00385E2545